MVSGSGYFNESEKLKIGSGVDFDNWTILFNLNNPDYNNSNGNQASVILSSQDSGDSTSGFSIGVNDSDRLYVQYTPSGGNKATFTHDSFVGENAVYSVSKNDSIFSINKHDFRNELNIVNLFTSSGYNKSEDWRFGDFTNSSANFTGFSGYLTDVAIFDSYLTPSQANTISRSYIISQISCLISSDSRACYTSCCNAYACDLIESGNKPTIKTCCYTTLRF